MDNNSFRDEIIKYIDNTYSDFCEYQRVALEILVEFDRVCSKNQLDYYLAYGSLIGAIRDHTQIPWDYDIDTLIRITDREKLLIALNRDLGEGFYYDYIDKTPTYSTSCLRICKNGYSMMALHVDVFFLIGTPNEETKRKRFIKKLINTMNMRTSKYFSSKMPQTSRFGGLVSLFYKVIPYGFLKMREDVLFHKYSLEQSANWCSNQSVYKKTYPKEIFASTIKVKVNDFNFPAPIGYKDFLSINYGEWQSYYPIKKRFEEFYRMKNLIDQRLTESL